MAKRIGKFRGITNRESALSLVDGGALGGNLEVTGTSEFGGLITANGGVLNGNMSADSSTSANVDLTSVSADYKLFLTGAWSSEIRIPDATVSNVGMTIEIFFVATADTDGSSKIIVEEASGTHIHGGVILTSTTANKCDAAGIHTTRNNTASLEFDADANDHCGGNEGTIVRLHYAADNVIFAEVRAITAGTAPAIDNNISTATGWS